MHSLRNGLLHELCNVCILHARVMPQERRLDMPSRRKLREHELFVQVFKAVMEQLGGNVGLTASDWRVMAVGMGGMIYGGFIQYSQKQIRSVSFSRP